MNRKEIEKLKKYGKIFYIIKRVKKGYLDISKKGVKNKNKKVIGSLNEATIYRYLKKKLKKNLIRKINFLKKT